MVLRRLLLLCVFGFVCAPLMAQDDSYKDDPRFQKAMADARQSRQTAEDRLDNWKHANKVAKGQCIECFRQIIAMQMRTGAYKDVVNTTQQMELVAKEPRDVVFAQAERANALMRFNFGQPKLEQITQAEALFHALLQKAPNARDLVFQEGRALAMLGRNDEAKKMFERYVDMVPASDKMRSRAERFTDDPHLATLQMAPPFRMVTSSGEEMNLDDMNGRVVLLDFWATWCGPCKKSLPEIARLAKDYEKDPMIVVISVSQDANESEWKSFIEKNHMTWPQYRDARSALSQAYGVSGIPHFFTIDTNGVLKTEQVGSNADVYGIVSDLVKKAHKAAAKAEKAKALASDKAAGQ